MMAYLGKAIVCGLLIVVFAVGYVVMFAWRSPPTYEPTSAISYDLMPWTEYRKVAASVVPPVILLAEPHNNGAALYFGATHLNDPSHAQFSSLQQQWDQFQPTVVLVEGRVGFFLPHLMDPVSTFGETGWAMRAAKKQDIPVYTWELSKENEIAALKQRFTQEQVAMLIILRPFWGSSRTQSRSEADTAMAKLIKERGRRPGIEGAINTVAQLDAIWSRDFPNLPDWRDLRGGLDLPGYIGQLFEGANDVRDQHLLNIVRELTDQGARVFVTAGWSHIVRIEAATR